MLKTCHGSFPYSVASPCCVASVPRKQRPAEYSAFHFFLTHFNHLSPFLFKNSLGLRCVSFSIKVLSTVAGLEFTSMVRLLQEKKMVACLKTSDEKRDR